MPSSSASPAARGSRRRRAPARRNGSPPDRKKGKNPSRDEWRPELGREMAADVGTRLREARNALGLTLEELEARSRISAPYLSKIERGRTPPPPETLRTIAENVGIAQGETERLLARIEFARDCADLVRMGYDAALAGVFAAASRLEDPVRQEIVSTLLKRFAPVLRNAAVEA